MAGVYIYCFDNFTLVNYFFTILIYTFNCNFFLDYSIEHKLRSTIDS